MESIDRKAYNFRLAGVPPEQAIKLIDVDCTQTIVDIKQIVANEFKLSPILALQFVFKGKLLVDDMKLTDIGINAQKDVITIMATQAGGAYGADFNQSRSINQKFFLYKIDLCCSYIIKTIPEWINCFTDILNRLNRLVALDRNSESLIAFHGCNQLIIDGNTKLLENALQAGLIEKIEVNKSIALRIRGDFKDYEFDLEDEYNEDEEDLEDEYNEDEEDY